MSFAAFAELDRRFSRPPTHAPDGPTPAPPTRLRIEENFRSVDPVLAVANRLIGANLTRYEPDKRLVGTRGEGPAVDVITCANSVSAGKTVFLPDIDNDEINGIYARMLNRTPAFFNSVYSSSTSVTHRPRRTPGIRPG